MKKLLYILTAICFCCCTNSQQEQVLHPRAITMWDFSWLERRWPGAGFEDWDVALDELTERGYDAVRIEAYPHLVGVDPTKEWVLDEVWNQQDWGSPDRIKVQVQPALNEFIRKCGERDIRVGLSSWYRTDTTHQEMTITTPEIMAERWINTLKTIDDAGLLDNILYVDLCNEWPGNIWAPFFNALYPKVYWGQWDAPESMEWMKKAIALVREAYPDLPLVFSTDSQDLWRFDNDLSYFDLVEHHIWMANQKQGEFLKAIDYKNGRFDPQAYKNVQANAERVYREKPDYWNNLLLTQINETAKVAERIGKPLITTECWGIIDYKDWPMLEWNWVKDLCEMGVKEAAATGQWVGIATSNFCAPQFVGMWRDIEWHQRLTSLIKSAPINPELLKSEEAKKLLKRL
ncbi:MAG: cellulase [Bacteroidaceae bacterium]|nr:cellulase [Bacteroidaceae bacterium]